MSATELRAPLNLEAIPAKKVCVLGAGSWGTTLAHLAIQKQMHEVTLYCHSPEEARLLKMNRVNARYLPELPLHPDLMISNDLNESVSRADILIFAVPAQAVRTLCQSLAAFVRSDQLIIHGIKGFDPTTLLTMSEIIRHELGLLRTGTLSGPNLAREIAAGLPAGAVIASNFDEVCQAGIDVFHQKRFFVEKNHNLLAVEYLGAFKNILALVAGLAEEWSVGQNATAFALCTIQGEILRLIKNQMSLRHLRLQSEVELLWGLAGFGDLFATATSPNSRNHKAGRLLAQGKNVEEIHGLLNQSIEGLWTLRAAVGFIKETHSLKNLNEKGSSNTNTASETVSYPQLEALASAIFEVDFNTNGFSKNVSNSTTKPPLKNSTNSTLSTIKKKLFHMD